MPSRTSQKTPGRGPDPYLALIARFRLRPLRTEEELDQAIQMLDSLLDRDELTADEKDYLDVLGDLVEAYEREEHPIAPVSDAEMLRHLLEAKGVTQSELAQQTGLAESTVSEVLSGKRALSRKHIAKVAAYFQVDPGVFAVTS